MKHIALCVIVNLIYFSIQVFCLREDYYWREYTGSIPGDAVVGGKNIDGNDIYIGQAYVKSKGLIVVQINSGEKTVYAPMNGLKTIDKHVKILCGTQNNFYWLPANSTHLHLTLTNKRAVIGGHQDDWGYINIGRIHYQNEIKIGKINSFHIANSVFYFIGDKKKELGVYSFEILIYSN